MSLPREDPTSQDSASSTPIHFKVTHKLSDFQIHGENGESEAAEAAAQARSTEQEKESSAMVNPFLSPRRDASGATLPSKSRQNHVFKDKEGKEKQFSSALGLLAARFLHMILVSSLLPGFASLSRYDMPCLTRVSCTRSYYALFIVFRECICRHERSGQ